MKGGEQMSENAVLAIVKQLDRIADALEALVEAQ